MSTHIEDIRTDGCRKIGRERILEFNMLVLVTFKCTLAHFAVGVLKQSRVEIALSHFDLLTLAVFGRGELKICIDQPAGAIGRTTKWVGCHAQNFFHFCRADMCLLAEKVMERIVQEAKEDEGI